MLEEIKDNYSKLYDKYGWLEKASKTTKTTPESLRILISKGELGKKHHAKVLKSLKYELKKQFNDEKSALLMDVNFEEVKPTI